MIKFEYANELQKIMDRINDDPTFHSEHCFDELEKLQAKCQQPFRDIRDGEEFSLNLSRKFRWMLYAETSNQFKKGLLGRFQERSEMPSAKWRNSDLTPELIEIFYKLEKPQ